MYIIVDLKVDNLFQHLSSINGRLYIPDPKRRPTLYQLAIG